MRLTAVAIVAAISMLVTGCAAVQYISKNYSDVTVEEVTTADDTFRIFDRPDLNKLMITPSFATAMAKGVEDGFTLGLTRMDAPSIPGAIFHDAVASYFAQKGRDCRIENGYLLADPQWEFRYRCNNGSQAQPVHARAPG